MSVSKETEAELWKIKALFLARASHKRKTTNAKNLAKAWDTTERQAYRLLGEADEIFIQLAPFFLIQPDCTPELVDKQLPITPRKPGRPKLTD